MPIAGQVPRAPRFAVRAPVRYRRPGDPAWSDGLSVNISRSGVLLAGGGAFAAGEAIEMWMLLSSADANVSDVRVMGRVVRAEDGTNGPQIAATIDSYRFQGESRLPSRGAED